MFEFKKKGKKKTPLMPVKPQSTEIKSSSPLPNQNAIAQKNKVEASDEIEKTAQIIHEDVTSAVATLRAWLNQDKLH